MGTANAPCTTDNLIVGPFNICLNGYDLGSTNGGVTISQAREYTEVRNDQSKTVQAIINTQQDFTITVTMRDMTLDKLRVLWGVQDEDSYREGTAYDPGDPTADPVIPPTPASGQALCITDNSTGCSFPEEFELTICGPGPGCGCRNFTFPRVVITPSTVDLLIQRDNPVEVAVEFRALAACPSGNIFCVTDNCDMIAKSDSGAPVDQALVCGDAPIPNWSESLDGTEFYPGE